MTSSKTYFALEKQQDASFTAIRSALPFEVKYQEFPIFRWGIPSLSLTRAAGDLQPRDQGGARKAPP
ncbi:MAG: hypothetical protein A3F10_02025 [Coxiella sp. RIFCSPHIGHO2_12_FULL_42_15]|nr:MAG: hypothetical protein A3F10_02025 [Coxiella sp. RIFCSPHIGHO2_12_FULL_42_15]